ncbi:MAG: noncanonical pyrimidine nucleotidase, YjjG family [Oscillospiraceae bacterium]|nr:noncanonical pyrimidine nucleotidase, YjjG family [Oscillospiraceae bacterium]MCI9317920.1 noncanonical pyrimidine nucleotidase, YjjG family [Oscillospiraceae bacterium]MDE6935661.1 YjjG family noncanonical pyrimidine nucleotidase [Oscillospiraceae bacterium]
MKYPYLLFDADNTLFDFDAAEKNAHRQVCGKHRLAFTEEGYALYRRCNAQLWQDFDRGLCSKEFLLTERFRRYLSLSGETGDPEAMNRDHLRALGESAVLLPGAEALCRRLAAGHELYLVTNAVESVQRARFERSAIRPYFRDVFISEAIGCGKPSPAYFAYVLRAVPGLTAENGLVIGDSLTSDIQGANNAGLACCWFNPKGLPRPDGLRIDYEVRTLEEIADLV